MVLSLYHVSDGKDYLVEVEDGDYNGNEYDDFQKKRVCVFTLSNI